MARALIFVSAPGMDPDTGAPQVSGEVRVEGATDPVYFSTSWAWGASPTQINQAIEDGAVAAAAANGHSISSGTNDRITLAAAKAL